VPVVAASLMARQQLALPLPVTLSARSGPSRGGAKLSSIPPENALSGKVTGVYVAAVRRGSRADEEGIEPGDIILSVNQQPVADPEALLRVLKSRGSEPAGADRPAG